MAIRTSTLTTTPPISTGRWIWDLSALLFVKQVLKLLCSHADERLWNRKKDEQAEAREAVKEERRAGQGFDDGMGAGRSGVQVD